MVEFSTKPVVELASVSIVELASVLIVELAGVLLVELAETFLVVSETSVRSSDFETILGELASLITELELRVDEISCDTAPGASVVTS